MELIVEGQGSFIRKHQGIAFVVVALGGLGNLLGAIAAGLLIGVAQAIVAAHWTRLVPARAVAVRLPGQGGGLR